MPRSVHHHLLQGKFTGPIFRLKFPGGKSVVYVADYALIHEACDEKRFQKNVTRSNPILNVSLIRNIFELWGDMSLILRKSKYEMVCMTAYLQ